MNPQTTARRRPALALVVLATIAAGCGSDASADAPGAVAQGPASAASAAAFPVEVESCGRVHRYDAAPERVLLGFPGTLATLDALGVGDVAYGYALGGYAPLPEDYPDDLVEVSPDYAPAREAVIAAAPDLFLSNDEGQLSGEGTVSTEDLDGLGAGSYVLGGYCVDGPAPKDIDVVYDDVEALGRIFGVAERAAEVERALRDRVEAARTSLERADLRVAFVQAYDGKLYALSGYPGSGILEALGQTNEFADLDANFAEINAEEALTRRPDVLFVSYVGDEADEEAAVAEVEKTLAGTPAVEAGRVYGLDDRYGQSGGVSIVDMLEYVAGRLAEQ